MGKKHAATLREAKWQNGREMFKVKLRFSPYTLHFQLFIHAVSVLNHTQLETSFTHEITGSCKEQQHPICDNARKFVATGARNRVIQQLWNLNRKRQCIPKFRADILKQERLKPIFGRRQIWISTATPPAMWFLHFSLVTPGKFRDVRSLPLTRPWPLPSTFFSIHFC